uniref:Phospholipid/glycerol acyltransferase domain-containing protein n=2 Tax=Oryza brachyantha TaxID=4533 RepID=J3N4V4_ORYBR
MEMEVYRVMATRNRFASRIRSVHRFVKTSVVAAAGLLGRRHPSDADGSPPLQTCVLDGNKMAMVVDVDRLLTMRPSSSASTALFPPFFLLAVEAGGFVRGLVLLALYPVMRLMTEAVRLKAMVMVCFLGLRRADAARAGRVVLPKYFSREAAAMEALIKAVASLPKEVTVAAVSRSFPTVMVETFLREYVGFDAVVGREVKSGRGHFAGVMDGDDNMERFRDVVSKTPKNAGPRPLIFHDGRLAFTPTPAAALAMYVYLPLGIALSVVRIAISTLLPRSVSGAFAALAGVRLRVTGTPPTAVAEDGGETERHAAGRLYACNHRTLLDAIAVSGALGRPVSSVCYSLGRLSELLSPIRLLRLTREREEDRRRMASLLSRGDVVVCPEGTTCREPYLLRFSPLFAELADEVNPVAVHAAAGMFYATSTSPLAKCFDSVFFMMNPSPEYSVSFLEPVATAGAGGSIEVANRVQRVIADKLGYEATALTRKAKYLLLAGNEGVVAKKN